MTQFTITVPEVLSDKEFVRFFLGWKWFDETGDDVVIDFSRCVFVAPWAAAMFAAYGRWLRDVRKRNVKIWLDPSTPAGSYLVRAGLPQFLGDTSHAPATINANRMYPISQVATSADIAPCANAILEILAVDDDEMAGAIKYSLIELLRNVVQHARSGIGAVVHACFMPTTGLVEICVADYGCGIRASLKERYPELKDDYKAVKFAMQPHVSGTFQRGAYESMANNAGLGLFFIKEIATRSGGSLKLASGLMLADLWGNPDGSPGKKYYGSSGTGWRGTFAYLQLRREHIAEFDALLQRCREIAAAVRKDPSELKLDFVNEVPELPGLSIVKVRDFEENVEQAADVRDRVILPALKSGQMVVLDFSGIRAATQSFAHALMYRLFRDGEGVEHSLSVACADRATQEAIKAVAAYASSPE